MSSQIECSPTDHYSTNNLSTWCYVYSVAAKGTTGKLEAIFAMDDDFLYKPYRVNLLIYNLCCNMVREQVTVCDKTEHRIFCCASHR
jgi:hypothetical protein